MIFVKKISYVQMHWKPHKIPLLSNRNLAECHRQKKVQETSDSLGLSRAPDIELLKESDFITRLELKEEALTDFYNTNFKCFI